MRPLGLTVVVALLGLWATGCGDGDAAASGSGGPGANISPPIACTAIGCGASLSLDVRRVRREVNRAERVRVCLAAKCRTVSLERMPFVDVDVNGLKDGQRVRVRMAVLGAGGDVLLRRRTRALVRKSQPNGPQCPPPCFQVSVRISGGHLRLVSS